MNIAVKKLSEITTFTGKKVLVRIDTDVDIENNKIVDDTRLKSAQATINYLRKKKANVIIVGHLGRPEEKFPVSGFQFPVSEKNKKFSLEIVAKWFKDKYNGGLIKTKAGDFYGWRIKPNLCLLENIRFYEGEEDPSLRSGQVLVEKLAGLADMYVNEAFAVSHRHNASIDAITKHLPSYAGFHLVREIEVLSKIIENPKRPLVVLIGGAKIETKLPMVEKMHRIADYVLVGGEIAEQDKVLIKVQHEKISGQKSVVLVADVKENSKDITDKSVENFEQIVDIAGTIVWNGPVGLINSEFRVQNLELRKEEDSERGTRELAKAIANSKAYKVVGGGDTLAFLRRLNLLSKFDFVSTGGGAMLEFLSGKKLPGIVPLLKIKEL